MHELGLTRRLLEVVLERAERAGAGRVSEVQLEIGSESDVAPAAVEFYWPEVSRGTVAEGAALAFVHAADPWAFRVCSIDVDDRNEDLSSVQQTGPLRNELYWSVFDG